MLPICWTSLSAKRVDTFLEFTDIYLMLPFFSTLLIYCLLVDLLTQFVGAKMTELKYWSVFACRIRILEKKYIMDIALYQSD